MEEKENKSGIPSVEARAETVSGGQENGQAGKKTDNQAKARRELTPKQVQQRKKLLVYPLMGLLFLGSMWLIFAPSDKKDESGETVGAFNADTSPIQRQISCNIQNDNKTCVNANIYSI